MKLRTAIIIILLITVAGSANAFCRIGDYECFQRERELRIQQQQLELQQQQLLEQQQHYQWQRKQQQRRQAQQLYDYSIKTESLYDSFMKGFNDAQNNRNQR